MNTRKFGANASLIVLQLVLAAGIAVFVGYLFRETIRDFMQHDSDAAGFFEDASATDFYFPLDETILANENALPVMMWRWFYGAANAIGLAPDPAWGIVLNALLVIGALLLSVQYARRKFGFDARQSMVLAIMTSLNGRLPGS